MTMLLAGWSLRERKSPTLTSMIFSSYREKSRNNMTTITSGQGFVEKMLGDITEPDDIYPFMVRVGCVKMAAPRHERFEYFLEMGRTDIDRVFDGRPFNKSTLTFVFPERHMGVHEQQAFMDTLTKHPHVDEVKRVDVITSSPLLISNFHNWSIRILT
jgi:hypothetical protein